jgi:hypothetical protein
MFTSQGADPIHINDGPAVASSGGFTAADLVLLGRVRAAAMARQIWSREQFVANEFAHYLAVWGPGAGAADPPSLVLARFKRTGTYALTMGTILIASGRSLAEVVRAIMSGFD